MITYTIINSNSGEIEARGCSLETAAHELLGYDNHVWSIEADPDGCFVLWVSRFGGGGNWPGGKVRTTVFSPKTDRAAAEADIFERVIKSGAWTRPEVMTDVAYDAMLQAFCQPYIARDAE